MTQSSKRLALLVGAVAILALAFAAVAPAFAQEGTDGQGGQTGTPVALEDGDTLGSLVNQYNFVGDNLRQFFSQNWDLVIDEGQTVVYPADVDVNFDDDAQGFADVDVEGRSTYVTQPGDTLGQVLGFTGFVRMDDAGTGMVGGNVVPTPTLDAGAGAGTTGDAGTTGTTGDDAAAGQETPTVAVDAGMTDTDAMGADLTDAQLEAFVEANEDLVFVEDQMVLVPSGVPVTGAAGQDDQVVATPTLAAGTDDQAVATPAAEETTAEGEVGTTTTYTVEMGDTLQSIADQFGVTVEELVDMNPSLVQPGMTLNVPAQGGQIPQTGDTGQEVEPTATPADTAGEVEVTPTPVDTTGQDVEPTATPADTTGQDVEPTATPADTTGQDIEPTATPADTTGQVEVTPTPEATPADTTQVTPTPDATPADTGSIPETGEPAQTGQNIQTICVGGIPSPNTGYGYYRYRGESLQFLADRTNSTVGDIIALNGADAFVRGNIITLPGAEAPGLWDNQQLRECYTVDLNTWRNANAEPQTDQ